ncbi:MAG TPA: hypothetical protein VGM59_10805 [Dongiaceae bacterium]
MGFDLLPAPNLRRDLLQERRPAEPQPLRLLVMGAAGFAATTGESLRHWAYARIETYLPDDIPPYLANSFDLAVVDCTTRNSALAAAIGRLCAASLPWIGAVPDLDGIKRAWLLDCGAADYVVGTAGILGARLAAAVAGFVANRKATALVVANGGEIRERLATTLSGLGFGTVSRWSGDTGKSMLCPSSGTRLVLFGPDLGLPKTLEWLDRIESPTIGKTISIVLAPTPFSSDVAAALIKHGAFDVLPPPYAPELLALRVNLAMRAPNLEAALRGSAGCESIGREPTQREAATRDSRMAAS